MYCFLLKADRFWVVWMLKRLGSKCGIDCIGSWMEPGQSELIVEGKVTAEY
jgi:hypothetical protein